MDYLRKIYCNLGIRMSRLINFKMQEIMHLRGKILLCVNSHCDDLSLPQLEEVRENAKSEGHSIEEFVILLDEYKCARFLNDKEYLAVIKHRLLELDSIFNSKEKFFSDWFDSVYLDNQQQVVKKQTYNYISQLYDIIQESADNLGAHLDFKSSLICSRMMLKLASLNCIEVEKELEGIYTFAVNFGYIADYNMAMYYYNIAIQKTREIKDDALEYVALMRKWSVCEISSRTIPGVNLDTELTSALQGIHNLCEKYNTTPDALGKYFLYSEERKKADSPSSGKEIEYRINRIKEAKPMYPLLLCLNRGDFNGALPYVEELKEAEMLAYGGDIGFSNAEQIIGIYLRYFDSQSRRNSSDEVENNDSTEDEELWPNFPEEVYPKDKYYRSLMYEGDFVAKHHYLSAQNMCDYAFELAMELYSDYYQAMALYNKAQIFEVQKEKEEAIMLYREVLNILENPNSSSDVDVSPNLRFAALVAMGRLLREFDSEESIDYYTKAIDEMPQNSSIQKSQICELLIERAEAYKDRGEQVKFEKDLITALGIIILEARLRIPFMDQEVREMYWEKAVSPIRKILSLLDDSNSEKLKIAAYNAVLFSKGILLSSEQTIKSIIENDPDCSSLLPLFNEVQEHETLQSPWGTQTEDSTGEYSEWYMKKTKLLLAVQDKVGGKFDFLDYCFDNVVSTLQKGQVVVDYFDYEIDGGDQQYAAFIVKAKSTVPTIIKLCKESDINAIFDDAIEEGSYYEAYNPRNIYSFELTRALWKPIENLAEMSLGDEVFFVPSGAISKIPIESLPIVEGKDILLSQYYRKIARLSHVRVLSVVTRVENWDSVALFGGLDYGDEHFDAQDPSNFRGYNISMVSDTPTQLEAWRYLGGTRQEVLTIANTLKMAQKKVMLFKEREGTVDSFKAFSGKAPDIIHIASHGFFETLKSAVCLPALQSNDPMSLSGLVLANGNEGWLRGDSKNHDGIITAAEVARMRLDSQLVILSACQTGDGVVKADGVYGLQRGFKKAGVKTLIMSLWNFEDQEGQLFMQLFYSKLVGGANRYKAFCEAKHEMAMSNPDDPLLWAGLIMLD